MSFEAAFASLPSGVAAAIRVDGGSVPAVFVNLVEDYASAVDLLNGISGEFDTEVVASDLVALSVLARAPARPAMRSAVAATGLDWPRPRL